MTDLEGRYKGLSIVAGSDDPEIVRFQHEVIKLGKFYDDLYECLFITKQCDSNSMKVDNRCLRTQEVLERAVSVSMFFGFSPYTDFGLDGMDLVGNLCWDMGYRAKVRGFRDLKRERAQINALKRAGLYEKTLREDPDSLVMPDRYY